MTESAYYILKDCGMQIMAEHVPMASTDEQKREKVKVPNRIIY